MRKVLFHHTLVSEMYIVLEEKVLFFTFPVLQSAFERKFVYCQET